MNQPFTPPPATVTYLVRINLGDWREYETPVNSSKIVSENLVAGNRAEVEFRNATDLNLVRYKFSNRIEDWLRQFGNNAKLECELVEFGAHYRLTE